MIDFAINDSGDISLEEQNETAERFKVNFSTSDYLPKMRIKFKARTFKKKKRSGAFKINFYTDDGYKSYGKRIRTVREDSEKAQSIAIRLKTELGELQDFFSDFGSELNKLRHEDIQLTDSKKSMIIGYVESAITDIFQGTPINVNVERLETGNSNFKLETLKITISTTSGKTIYTYTI